MIGSDNQILSQLKAGKAELSQDLKRARELGRQFKAQTVKPEIDSFKAEVRKEIESGKQSIFGHNESTRGRIPTSALRPQDNIKAEVAADPERKKLYDAARDFQAIFVNMMLKSMRSTLNRKDDMFYGGQKQEIFEDMLYDEYSKKMSFSGDFKLADQIYRQLSPGLPPIPEEALQAALKGELPPREITESYKQNLPENISTGQVRREWRQ